MDSMKNCQKPSAGYRNAEHLSMLCDWIVAERIQISTVAKIARNFCHGWWWEVDTLAQIG